MSTFTKLYLTTLGAPYTPATLRGAWDDTAAAVTKMLSSGKEGYDETVSVAREETSTNTSWDVLLYRGVSCPLAAQTISGDLNVMIGAYESVAAADFNWHVHVYVTTGDSDTVRGTLLTDYTESAGTNEWGTAQTTSGLALNAATAMSSVVASSGDRIVVEIGYVARNSVATYDSGTLFYGTTNLGVQLSDLTAGADPNLYAGYVSFSNAITENNPTVRLTQSPVRVLRNADSSVNNVRLTQASVRVMYNVPTGIKRPNFVGIPFYPIKIGVFP